MTIPPDEIRAAVGDSWRVALRTSEMTGELHANAATLAGMLLEMGGTPDRAIRLLPSNRGPLWRQVHEYLVASKRAITTTATNVIPFPRTARKSIP